ncbi:hypothetical protein M409DRAFT_54307 [Zasmidium cellare ATCC 36951]|uniref:S-adenosyl-L-methionine-dependent methyltransferase n=1 Tax=Zasmidium cellare ATCC 36951 TaxID=1080233 RepID=A0A6A6CMF2_ZASCE|nr:uncharacterized protein M409DRAFT_54307 [Zasmidium cellare ATCC 36951]KAF2167102.1 hypothetical protein M409DRAFT_54307 [Zasmidium cellare ATCC 36951]
MASAVSDLSNRQANDTRFNKEAAAWDSRPGIHKASKHACGAILAQLNSLAPEKPLHELEVLEIGCGTGVLSFLLAPHVKRIVAVDAAEGMIDVLKQKLDKPDAPRNIVALALLLEDPEDPSLPPAEPSKPDGPRLKFDLITSHLVLHHIPDLTAVLQTMHECLAPDGRVMLTDFQDFGPEAQRFHARSRMEGVCRHGIATLAMEALMLQAGFVEVEVEPKWTMSKTVERFDGEFGEVGMQKEGMGKQMDFPFVLCCGVKEARHVLS